jgi:hypothetical protein
MLHWKTSVSQAVHRALGIAIDIKRGYGAPRSAAALCPFAVGRSHGGAELTHWIAVNSHDPTPLDSHHQASSDEVREKFVKEKRKSEIRAYPLNAVFTIYLSASVRYMPGYMSSVAICLGSRVDATNCTLRLYPDRWLV